MMDDRECEVCGDLIPRARDAKTRTCSDDCAADLRRWARAHEEQHDREFADTGCEVHHACLECPLPACKHDDPRAYVLWMRTHTPVIIVKPRPGVCGSCGKALTGRQRAHCSERCRNAAYNAARVIRRRRHRVGYVY